MTYLEFLLQWYNWPYLAALALAAIARVLPSVFRRPGETLVAALSLRRVAPHTLLAIFSLALGIVGLTINGALHDYSPDLLSVGFVPALLLSVMLAATAAHVVGRVLQRHFPEIRAVGFGARDLAGQEGRVVSRRVGPEYRAGRAQVMMGDGTLHMVLCKTRTAVIPYGAKIVLQEYDSEDGRYYVRRAGSGGDAAAGSAVRDEPAGRSGRSDG